MCHEICIYRSFWGIGQNYCFILSSQSIYKRLSHASSVILGIGIEMEMENEIHHVQH